MSINISGNKDGGGIADLNFTKDSRLKSDCRVNKSSHFVSVEKGLTFNYVFEDASAAAGDYVAYLKNTSTTRNLVIELVRVWSTSTAVWKVVTATGTATGGTTVTAVSMNRGLNITPEATALADNVGGFTAGSALIADEATAANSSSVIPFDDTLILGTGDAIAIERDAAGSTDRCGITMRVYFEDK